jgi:hypothetical protein
MHYLQPAIDLAHARGYLQCPEVLVAEAKLPDWFRLIGTREGIADFETRHAIQLPAALKEYYLYTPLACFLDAAFEGEIFLKFLAPSGKEELPPIITWGDKPYLVFSYHLHSGMVFAAELGTDDPLCYCGWDGDLEPYHDEKRPPQKLSEWIFSVVEEHEARLDYWQREYLAEGSRNQGMSWIRALPGMSQRLG